MIMTYNEYHYYSDIAIKLFNYMNGNINRVNSQCQLYIDMYDNINNTYANIRYPNFIFIHIGTIIDSWDDDWICYMNKDSYVVSCISWALAHELHHADQLLSMIQYNANPYYKKSIEGDVERASYDWVANHSKEISNITGIDIVIRDIDSPSLPDTGNYRKASVSQFYKQTIANIIIRDLNLFNKLKVFIDDSMCDDIVLNFNETDSVVIKSYGKYLAENVIQFSSLSYKYAGFYDLYHIKVSVNIKDIDNRKIAIVDFVFTDSAIKPMIFKQK